jgi:hypothetical protein
MVGRFTKESVLIAVLLTCAAGSGTAQQFPVTGRVLDAETAMPIAGVRVALEGQATTVLSDSLGRFQLPAVAAGPWVLRAEMIGYADARTQILMGATFREQLILMVRNPLRMPEIVVSADPHGRARGELGTASVIGREAIRHQTATSLAGVLELVPGTPLQAPGLDNVQQVQLRTAPVAAGTAGVTSTDFGSVASFATVVILDGVPLSNNANVQTLGPRGELGLRGTGGGGIDLRRIPATVLDRVEVIRGVPSVRYGDVAQGVIVVDTRAGGFGAELTGRFDGTSWESAAAAGHEFGRGHATSLTVNLARTPTSPGITNAFARRATLQFAHGATTARAGGWRFDTRADSYQLQHDDPEDPDVLPGRASAMNDQGMRLSHRARSTGEEGGWLMTGSLQLGQQTSFIMAPRLRNAMPFTDRLEPGVAEGRFIIGQYIARADVDGRPRNVYSRLERTLRRSGLGVQHELTFGVELRREWNAGAGYQFDMEFPPQVTFTGVQGFDRPRRADSIQPLASSSGYAGDRITGSVAGMAYDVQAGVRADVLHEGGAWWSAARHVAVQPRINAQLAPREWLRLRAGAGRTAKLPGLVHLAPAPQYFDVVNVNWYPPDPAERLAVLTTFILDPTNPELRQAVGRKLEAGIELGWRRDAALSIVAFDDVIRGGFAFDRIPEAILRHRYQLTNATPGSGSPPVWHEPPIATDTIPVMLQRPMNNTDLASRGVEFTAVFPQVLRTALNVSGAFIESRLSTVGIETNVLFTDMQLGSGSRRAPFWDVADRTGKRGIVTYNLTHHQPELGFIITAVVQHTMVEQRQRLGRADSLAFAGFITTSGEVVRVPEEARAEPQYADLRTLRVGVTTDVRTTLPDWLLSLQARKTLPGNGTLAFFAFNALDRIGRYGSEGQFQPRLFQSARYGLEVSLPAGALWPR